MGENSNESVEENGYHSYIETIKFMMKLTGLWRSPTERRLNGKRFILIFAILVTAIYGLTISLFQNLTDIFAVVETLLYLSLYVNALHAYCHMARNQEVVNKMFNDVEGSFQRFEENTLQMKTGLKKKTDMHSRLLIQVVATSIAIAHVFRTMSTEVHHPNSPKRKLFFPFALHFYKSDSLYYYYPLYILLFLASMTGALINVLSIGVCNGFINVLSCEIDILKLAFQDARKCIVSSVPRKQVQRLENSERQEFTTENDNSQVQLYGHLKKLIVQHIYLIRSSQDVQVVISPIAFNMLLTSEFMLCFSSFEIYQMCTTAAIIDYPKIMDSTSMLVGLMCQQFVYFVFGQKLESKSTPLHEFLYYTDWYNATPEYKRCLNIMFEKTRQPLLLTAGSLIPINFNSLVVCLQASFSYFNLLRALTSN